MNNKHGQGGIVAIIGIAGTITLIFVLWFLVAVDSVDEGEYAVLTKYSKAYGTQEPSWQHNGIMAHATTYNTKLRRMDVNMICPIDTKTGLRTKCPLTAVDKDGQTVGALAQVLYFIDDKEIRTNPDKLIQIYRTYGKDKTLEDVLNLEGKIRATFKATASKYTSMQMIQNRTTVQEEFKQNIFEVLGENGVFTVDSVTLSDLDFNPAFTDAIELQKTNERLAEAAKAAVAIKQFEAQQIVAEAEGNATAQKRRADAEAYQLIAIAEAEAKSIRLKATEITSMMVQNNWIDAWAKGGSQVPKLVVVSDSSESASNMNMLWQMPTVEE